MIKFAIGIAIAILAANVLANSIDLDPNAGAALDRANVIAQTVAQ